jgi:hypothetical protein
MGKAHDMAYLLLKKASPEKLVGISNVTAFFRGENILGRLSAALADHLYLEYVPKFFSQVDFFGMSYYSLVPMSPLPVTEIENPGKLDKMGICPLIPC